MKRKFVFSIGIYIVAAVIRFLYIGNTQMADVGGRCLSDHLCDVAYYGYSVIYPIILIIMIGYFSDFFRSAVILRYRYSEVIIRNMLFRCFGFSILFSVMQTCIAVFTGLSMTKYTSNWHMWDSYVTSTFGIIMEKQVPTIILIVLYLYVTFIHIFIIGCIMCMMWYLTETPIAGFVSVLIVIVYESTARSRDVFFNVISMEESKVVLGMPGIWELVIYPMMLLVVIAAAMRVIICNKDFVRLT